MPVAVAKKTAANLDAADFLSDRSQKHAPHWRACFERLRVMFLGILSGIHTPEALDASLPGPESPAGSCRHQLTWSGKSCRKLPASAYLILNVFVTVPVYFPFPRTITFAVPLFLLFL